MGKKKRKIRVAFRKNRQRKPRRLRDFSGQLDENSTEALPYQERVSGKGDLSRQRTVITDDAQDGLAIDVDEASCTRGRVLSIHRSGCLVQSGDGMVSCVVRQLLKKIAEDARTAVIPGDRVVFRRTGDDEGVIERVEPRSGTLSREVRGQQQVLVSNVDQVLIVASAADPQLKPNLIDRYLVSAEVGGIAPVICINKIDLIDLCEIQPIVGVYSRLGYDVVPTSASTGCGMSRLRNLLAGRETVLTGQSGVGKSSLLNAIQPGLQLATQEVAAESRKGRHTTTATRLLQLTFGGWVVDTPGIRQMGLWDTIPEEVEGYFIEFHPFVRRCRFPDCSHTHESACGVKEAVSLGLIGLLRYESYCRIVTGDFA